MVGDLLARGAQITGLGKVIDGQFVQQAVEDFRTRIIGPAAQFQRHFRMRTMVVAAVRCRAPEDAVDVDVVGVGSTVRHEDVMMPAGRHGRGVVGRGDHPAAVIQLDTARVRRAGAPLENGLGVEAVGGVGTDHVLVGGDIIRIGPELVGPRPRHAAPAQVGHVPGESTAALDPDRPTQAHAAGARRRIDLDRIGTRDEFILSQPGHLFNGVDNTFLVKRPVVGRIVGKHRLVVGRDAGRWRGGPSGIEYDLIHPRPLAATTALRTATGQIGSPIRIEDQLDDLT